MKYWRIIRSLLIGAILGGILGIAITFTVNHTSILNVDVIKDIGYIFIGLLFVLWIICISVIFIKMNKVNNLLKLSHDDEIDIQLNKEYNNISLFGSLSTYLIIGFYAFSLIIITRYSIAVIVLGLSLIFCTTYLNRKIVRLSNKVKGSDFDFDFQDKKMMSRMIDCMDEGEKLIALHSLSDTYSIMVLFSSIAMIILSGYQIYTGENQILAILIFLVMLIVSAIRYYSKLNEYNK